MTSWREEKKERTRDAIAGAALRRFVEHGYDSVAVADIARAAEVSERTVYRYFVDKEELLFADDGRIQDALAVAMAAGHPDLDPLSAMRAAARSIAAVFDDQRSEMRQRAVLIAATPALHARERVKQAGWQNRLAEMLAERGVPALRARLYGAIGVACFVEALTRWLAPDRATPAQHHGPASLSALIDHALSDVATLVAEPDHLAGVDYA